MGVTEEGPVGRVEADGQDPDPVRLEAPAARAPPTARREPARRGRRGVVEVGVPAGSDGAAPDGTKSIALGMRPVRPPVPPVQPLNNVGRVDVRKRLGRGVTVHPHRVPGPRPVDLGFSWVNYLKRTVMVGYDPRPFRGQPTH